MKTVLSPAAAAACTYEISWSSVCSRWMLSMIEYLLDKRVGDSTPSDTGCCMVGSCDLSFCSTLRRTSPVSGCRGTPYPVVGLLHVQGTGSSGPDEEDVRKESLTCSGSHTFSSGNAGSPTMPYQK
jgi:hypothetical protein